MITTKKIQLSRKELFDILVSQYLKKRWWMVITVFALAIWMSFYNINDTMDYLVIGAALAYPFIIMLQFWGYANSKDNRFYLQPRVYEIDENRIIARFDDGTTSTLLNKLIKKRVKTRNYYLVYISNHKFLYIPRISFANPDDRQKFENLAGFDV